MILFFFVFLFFCFFCFFCFFVFFLLSLLTTILPPSISNRNMDKISRQTTVKDVKSGALGKEINPPPNDPSFSSSSSSISPGRSQQEKEKRLSRTKSMFGMKKNHEIIGKSNLMMKVGEEERREGGGEGQGSFNLLDGKSREERRNRARTVGGKAKEKDGVQRKSRRLTFMEEPKLEGGGGGEKEG